MADCSVMHVGMAAHVRLLPAAGPIGHTSGKHVSERTTTALLRRAAKRRPGAAALFLVAHLVVGRKSDGFLNVVRRVFRRDARTQRRRPVWLGRVCPPTDRPTTSWIRLPGGAEGCSGWYRAITAPPPASSAISVVDFYFDPRQGCEVMRSACLYVCGGQKPTAGSATPYIVRS